MGSGETSQGPDRLLVAFLAGGLAMYLCFMLGVFAIFVLPAARNLPGPWSTPTPTPVVATTPHILVHVPAADATVHFEGFSSDIRGWGLAYASGKLEIRGGKMILQGYPGGWTTLAENPRFILPASSYYVQADFMTDVDTLQEYGLVFGRNNVLDDSYAFEIVPRSQRFVFYKVASGKPQQLGSAWNLPMNPYPLANTLSAYFDAGHIDLYINGRPVFSYADPQPYLTTGVGAVANYSGYRLIVDNFFAYSGK